MGMLDELIDKVTKKFEADFKILTSRLDRQDKQLDRIEKMLKAKNK